MLIPCHCFSGTSIVSGSACRVRTGWRKGATTRREDPCNLRGRYHDHLWTAIPWTWRRLEVPQTTLCGTRSRDHCGRSQFHRRHLILPAMPQLSSRPSGSRVRLQRLLRMLPGSGRSSPALCSREFGVGRSPWELCGGCLASFLQGP